MQQAVEAVLRKRRRGSASGLAYVTLVEPQKPVAIRLPTGLPWRFATRWIMIDDLKTALPACSKVRSIKAAERDRSGLPDQARRGIHGAGTSRQAEHCHSRTPHGLCAGAAQDGQVVPPDEFGKWPEGKRREVQEVIQALEKDLEHIVRQIPQWEKARRDEVRKLNRETAMFAVGQSIDEAKAEVAEIPRIAEHLDAVRSDLIDNVAMFVMKSEGDEDNPTGRRTGIAFERYEVNVLVAHDGDDKAVPIVQELHPTLSNLIGGIEYVSQHGVLVTNFKLIKAGALHRANGGFLLLDVRHLLMEPFSWSALKRTLRQREIRIEDVGRFIGLASTVSLEPDPIPLDVKIVLFGDRLLYYLLAAFDPDVSEHFKVLADFEDDVDRSPSNEAIHARLIASLVRRNRLKEIDRDGVSLILEHAARIADHAGKLTLLIDQIKDVLTEADYWAAEAKNSVTTRADVQRALDERVHRSSRLRDRARESILQDIALIDTTGVRVGQSWTERMERGYRFGRPPASPVASDLGAARSWISARGERRSDPRKGADPRPAGRPVCVDADVAVRKSGVEQLGRLMIKASRLSCALISARRTATRRHGGHGIGQSAWRGSGDWWSERED
jgi:hypothetical protein